MPIWKITNKGPRKVEETKLKKEIYLEENIENWIIEDSSILEENLLVIGRQVIIPDIRDRLDILALDSVGNSVIIELKRGKLKDPVDMQALRYASYISKWRFEEFENQARIFMGKVGDPEFNFNEIFEDFCSEKGNLESPDLNSDQRIIIVGSELKDKLASVALWLREHNVDIKVVQIECYREENNLLIQPQVLIPLPTSKISEIGKPQTGPKPWITNGKSWHLDKRCSPATREMLLKIDALISDNFEVDGPKWNQKHYVSYRLNNYNWLAIVTRSSNLELDFFVSAGAFRQDTLAKRLGIKEFINDESLAEKFGLPSSVKIYNRNVAVDKIILRIKEDFDIEKEAFVKFIKDAFAAFPK